MRKKSAPFSQVNMVPYLDVMLVLLIIFMVVAPVVHMRVNVSLPKVTSSVSDVGKSVVVVFTLDKSGRQYLQLGDALPVEVNTDFAMTSWFQQQSIAQDQKIHVRADRSLAWEVVLRSMAQLGRIGYQKVSLVSQPNS